jgi:hypothetical protein
MISGFASPASAVPFAGAQATSNSGCVLASSKSTLYAMWADISGQLQYAATLDGVNWQYLGTLGNPGQATTAPDSAITVVVPPHPPPIKL